MQTTYRRVVAGILASVLIFLITYTTYAILVHGPDTDNNIRVSGGPDDNPRVASLLRELRQRRSRGYGDHTAIMMASHIGEQGSLNPWMVFLVRRLDTMDRMDTLYVGENETYGTLRKSIIAGWPHLKITEVLALERQGPIYERIVEGKNVTVRTSKDFGTQRFPSRGRSECQYSMVNWAWPDPDFLARKYTPSRKVELQIVSEHDKPSGWVGLRVTSLGIGAGGQETQRMDTYWFDAAKDYVLMEHTTDGDLSGEYNTWHSQWSTLEVAQTPHGSWYPVKKRSILKYGYYDPQKNIKTVESEKDYLLCYDETAIPHEEVFSEILTGAGVTGGRTYTEVVPLAVGIRLAAG